MKEENLIKMYNLTYDAIINADIDRLDKNEFLINLLHLCQDYQHSIEVLNEEKEKQKWLRK